MIYIYDISYIYLHLDRQQLVFGRQVEPVYCFRAQRLLSRQKSWEIMFAPFSGSGARPGLAVFAPIDCLEPRDDLRQVRVKVQVSGKVKVKGQSQGQSWVKARLDFFAPGTSIWSVLDQVKVQVSGNMKVKVLVRVSTDAKVRVGKIKFDTVQFFLSAFPVGLGSENWNIYVSHWNGAACRWPELSWSLLS